MTIPSKVVNEKRQGAAQGEARGYGEGGPVFLPRRRLSPLAQALLTGTLDGEGVTGYDELWSIGRPCTS